ncbi:MAG TPA: TonB-dependent receptor, partial [Vicinamibacteria bacterium]
RALGGNPGLRPERTAGGEIGLDHSFRRAGLDFGATLFVHEYRDLVDFDFQSFRHVNRSRVRARGAELQARWHPLAKLEVQGEATWLDARDLSGAALLHRPRWLGGGRLVWRPTDRLNLRFEGRGVSSYLDEELAVPDRDGVAGYGLFACACSWRWRPRWTLRARVDNLGGRAYETLIGFPGPKRSFWVGLGWERP